jgi:MFS family permease
MPFFVASRGISVLGDMAALSALSVSIYQSTGSATMVGGLFVARVLPRLFGPLAGALSDRLPLKVLLVGCDVAAGSVFVVIALIQPPYWGLLALVLVAESVATVAMPGARTWVAQNVPKDRLAVANGTVSSAVAIGFATGAALGGASVGLFGYRYALLINAATFTVSALLMANTKAVGRTSAAAAGLLATTVKGLQTLVSDARLWVVCIGLVGVAFAASIDRPAVVALTQDNLHAGGTGYGVVLGAVSIGALVAALSMGRVRRLQPSRRLFVISIVGQAVGHLALGLSMFLAVAVVAALVMGTGNGVENVAGATLLQRDADPAAVGAVLGAVMSATFIADAIGSVIGGVLVDRLGARPVFVISAVLMAVCAVAGGRFASRAQAGSMQAQP